MWSEHRDRARPGRIPAALVAPKGRGTGRRWEIAEREAQAAPPPLPPLESLTPDSDFRPFLHPKVEEGLRRAALKKLFADPRFNVMDGLDVYIDDYSNGEPLPEAMLATLQQAQNILRWARQGDDHEDRVAAAETKPAAPEAPPDEEAPHS